MYLFVFIFIHFISMCCNCNRGREANVEFLMLSLYYAPSLLFLSHLIYRFALVSSIVGVSYENILLIVK